jgi:4'-phosphopantetheinyl transferase
MNVARHPAPTIEVREYFLGSRVTGTPALGREEIHIWHQNLARGLAEVEALGSLLSPDEMERAQRFRFEANRNEFMVCRGTLRTLLGHYVSVPPKELCFEYSEYGRPRLATGSWAGDLDFNVSHSGGHALLGFARGRKVGLDIEKIRKDFGTGEIAERFFSEAERSALLDLPQEQKHEAFFRCWTRKEAFIKALGEGLSHPLDQFDVSLAPSVPAQLLATRPDAKEAQRWRIWDLQAPTGYTAALVAESDLS